MGDEVRNLSSKLGLDTTDFKTAIVTANRELRVLESGFKAGAATMVDWSKDANGLEMRIKSLTGQFDIQKLKVDALRAEHQRLADANGANSRAAKNAEIELNKETATLNKMELELKQDEKALVGLKNGSEKATTGVKSLGTASVSATAQIQLLGSVVKMSMAAMMAMIAVVVGLALAIGGLVLSTASASAEMTDMSVKTGLSTTALQEYNYIANQTGTSLDTITGAQAKLVRGMSTAQDEQRKYNDAVLAMKDGDPVPELGAAAAAFKTLGVATTDAGGQLRSADDVFRESIDALGKIQNPAERDAAAMALFGKSAQELNPLIKAGSAELARLAQEANQVGAVMSEENVAAGAALMDTLDSLKDGFSGLAGTIAAIFLPSFQGLASQAQDYLGQFASVVKDADGDIGKIAEGASGILVKIAENLAKGAPQMVQSGLNIVKTLVASILPALPSLAESGALMLVELIKGIIAAAPTMIKAGLVLVTTLLKAIADSLPEIATMLATVIPEIAQVLIDSLPLLLAVTGQLVLAIIQALFTQWQTAWPSIPTMVSQKVSELWPILQAWIASLGQQLSDGFTAMFGQSIAAFGEWLAGLGAALMAGFEGLGAIIQTVGLVILGLVLILLDGILSLFGTNLSELSTSVQNGWTQLVATVSKKSGEILATLSAWGKKVFDTASKAWNDVSSSVGTALDNILTILGDALQPVTDAMSAIWQSALDTAGGFIDQFFAIGANIIGGIGAGIQSGADALGKIIQDVIDAAIAKAKAFLGIASDSKVFAREVGFWIPGGIGAGIEAGIPTLQKRLSTALGGLTLNPALSGAGGRNYTDNSNTYYGAVYNVYRSGESGPQKSKRF